MNRIHNIIKHFTLLWLFLLSQQMFSQLADFNFSVTTTNETCAGNGSISMTVSGTTAGSTLFYTLYLSEDTGTAIAQTSTNTFNNLSNGNYVVVATQTLGTVQNTQSRTATIVDETTSLDFDISQGGACDTADLIVNLQSGNAVAYELLSGPVTAPPQASNIFSGLPEGTYTVRVFDTCDNALSKTFTIILNNNALLLEPLSLPSIFTTCNAATITNTISVEEDEALTYPITVTYTIYPPDGTAPLTVSNTYTIGPEFELDATQTIALYGNQIFDIDIVVVDACGHTITLNDEVNPNPLVDMYDTEGYCGKNLNVQVVHFMPPYSIEFTEAPEEFNPTIFNENYPDNFTTTTTIFGLVDQAVPYGNYTIVVTDACGRTGTKTFEVVEEPIEPEASPFNTGCNPNLGGVTVTIPDREIVSAIFTTIPDAYNGTPPVDVSNSISNGILIIHDLPIGDYILELIDECGTLYIVELSIPEFTELFPIINTTPNCTTPTGTLRIAGPYGALESVIIIDAPDSFTQTLPYDYSANILGNGIFYVGNLPEGSYTIEFTDTCGNEFTIIQPILTYVSNPAAYNLQRNCGSFNITILDNDLSVWDKSYWFQKYNTANNTWGHPNTGAVYNEDEMPTSTTAIQLQNEETLYNIFHTGTFRLIKAFQPFNNPSPGQRCYDVFAEFDISSDLLINGIYNLNCDGGTGPSDVLVDVIGVEPYNFSIASPITLDNGSNNIFTNLSPGTYEIRVEDACGSIKNIFINLEDLLPVVNIFAPTDLVMCSDNGNNQATFDLSEQNPYLIGTQNPNNYTITYHLTQNDADTGANALSEDYENISNPQTLFARVIHNELNVCYATASFQLIVGTPPQLSADETIVVCDGSSVTLMVDVGHDGYLWSTGETTSTISVSASGIYTVTVSENYGDFTCDAVQVFTVHMSSIATIDAIVIEDWSANQNSITVEVSGMGDYEYSLNGITYQPSSYFSNLAAGEYTVYVRDINGCGVVTEQVYLLDYMKFFTPNADGYHDYWQINGSGFDPNLQVIIFDRYGKLLTAFKGNDIGWNGTYNGEHMPTNDYWFVVTRSNGKTYKGHFTLKR